jgi:hypothetical protein
MALGSFATSIYLEQYHLDFLQNHPISVNLISGVVGFSTGLLVIGLGFNFLVERDRLAKERHAVDDVAQRATSIGRLIWPEIPANQVGILRSYGYYPFGIMLSEWAAHAQEFKFTNIVHNEIDFVINRISDSLFAFDVSGNHADWPQLTTRARAAVESARNATDAGVQRSLIEAISVLYTEFNEAMLARSVGPSMYLSSAIDDYD